MDEPLKRNRESGCWTLTRNRPEQRNALSTELVEALIAGVEGAHAQDLPLLVICGAGTNLSAGFDFTGYQDHSDGDLVLRMVRIEHLLQLIADRKSTRLNYSH